MKRGLLMLIFLFAVMQGFGQGEQQYVAHYTLRNRVKKDTLVDNELKMKFILDSTRIYISAVDLTGRLVWKADPWADNNLEAYRVKRPVIIYYGFQNNESTEGVEKIWITYNNTQFGTVDKLTGKFRMLGQD